MIGAGKRREIQRLERERSVVRMTAEEMTPAGVINEVDRRASGEIRGTVQMAADPGSGQGLFKATTEFVIANMTDEEGFRPQPCCNSRAIGAAAANGFGDPDDRGFAVFKQLCSRRERRSLEVAIDVADHAQLRSAQG